ncbi:hypothetical protein KGP17_22775 [Serratia sp. JSRIV001]|uniref:hypothetical protein n=1 Tax=unclassified Serratia (in: enterobacteria) TaxID=2647522 RepID=UPI001CBECB13|nr:MULTISPECIES: hypothetical protein [unclassified Serratia (in: enterobacteria)]UAN45193.1 hypothetical protein KGP17_22775 [Serratia sp. JSRIV001]UAN54534.1 hypothetical protein KGP26_28465 [Serratia sp. JSRIV002]UAN60545.1 hypothetical protein KGP21_28800 [Serratia sp. JSRIV004]
MKPGNMFWTYIAVAVLTGINLLALPIMLGPLLWGERFFNHVYLDKSSGYYRDKHLLVNWLSVLAVISPVQTTWLDA